jgi:transposase
LPPSYEDLAALVVELKLLVSAQAERIAELERQVASDSRCLAVGG